MSPPPIEPHILQFDMWETMDEVTMEMASTSEFWTQIECEVDRLELVPPASLSLQDSDADWRIPDSPEDHKDNIVHHDCMWAGSCADSVHPSNTFVPAEMRGRAAQAGQSLLRRDASPPRPDTPPSLDGDEHPCPFEHVVDVAGAARRLLRDSAAVAADHSYTLARQRIDYLGVQTPSDSCESEEEIDVVSVGTTHQPLAGVTQVRAEPAQRTSAAQYPEPARAVARKRLAAPALCAGPSPRRRARGPGRRPRRANTDSDSEAESPEIERRSIHNDMERQRRIGLKNLFDELKKQIPATRDKERAPKVVILREAAALCRKLREEEHEREALRKHQNKLVTKLRKLRMMVSRYRSY